MKIKIPLILTALTGLIAAVAFGTQQTINVGSTNNDGNGDPLRVSFQKANLNFSELYSSTPAANLTGSHTAPDGVLSTNVPLLNALGQTYNPLGTNKFGSIIIDNSNTTNIPIQVYTNLNATNGASTVFQAGTHGTNNLFELTLNPGHGGLGDGSEVGITANQIAIVGNTLSGGRIQVGGQGLGSPWAISLQDTGSASGSVPFTANGGIVDWKYGWWNGSSAVRAQFDEAVSTVNITTGQGTLTVFDPFVPAVDNSTPTNQTHRRDIIGGVGVKGYGASILDYTTTTPGTSNYWVNMAMAAQDAYMSGPLNVAITNVAALTNTASGTLSAFVSDCFFYSGITSNLITFSNNPAIKMIWENDTGTAVAPTNVPPAGVLHVKLTMAITGGLTNCYASAKLGTWAFAIDTDAQKFFSAVAGAGGSLTATEKTAVNNLVIAMKSDGSWASNDVIYPLVGGTTNSMSWNLKNTNTFRLAFNGTVTTNANGFAGDGSTGYADTGFKPASSAVNYSQHEASVTLYNHAGGVGRFYGSLDSGSLYSTLQSNSTTSVEYRLNEAGDSPLSTPSGLAGFFCATVHAGTMNFFGPGGSGTQSDATVAPPNQNMFLGARNGIGSADSFSTATISFFAVGGGLSTAMESAQAADVLAFETTLGRQ